MTTFREPKAAATALDATPPRPARAKRSFMRRLLGRPLAVLSIAYLLAVVIVAIVAPIALPHVMIENAGDLAEVNQAPTAAHVLGTDSLGRDVLNRLLVGTRSTMIGVVQGLLVAILLGVPAGVIAGFVGGALDRVLSWIADLAFSIPSLVIILVVLSVFPQSMLAGMVAFGVLIAPYLMRLVRSATLPVREELYIDAARVSGLSRRYIVARHVLPRIAGPIIVQISLLAATALLVQTGLAYLHLVVAPPQPSWGGMVADGVQNMLVNPWLVWPAGATIAATMLAFCLLADEIRDTTVETYRATVKRAPRSKVSAALVPAQTAQSPLASITPAVASGALLSLEHVSIALPTDAGPVLVVDDVTLDVNSGEIVGIVGESGCGKTMTAMAILGLLPGGARISGGKVMFEGRDLAAQSEKELQRIRGKEVALISQDPMVSLNPSFRVGAQLEHTLRIHHKLSRRDARIRAIELLEQVRLPDPAGVARRYPHELSGGMAQRVAIARALSGSPKLLVADEPTTALDVTVQAEILELMRELAREKGMSVLIVSHDWGVIADLCDRAVVMYAGQVVERADISPIFYEPLHPYTGALLSSNPHTAEPMQLLPTIPGAVPKPGSWPVGCHFADRCRFATEQCTAAPIPMLQPDADRETRCIRYEAFAEQYPSSEDH